MTEEAKPEIKRKQHLEKLLYQLHRLIFTANDLTNQYSSKVGLHGKDGEALLQIWQAELSEQPLSPSQLAKKLQITRAAVSYLTDRLVDSGYVNRETSDSDRRKTILRISELGGKIGHDFTAPMEAGLKGLFANRSENELATFSEMLGQFLDSLDTSPHQES